MEKTMEQISGPVWAMFLPHVQQAINSFEKEFYGSIDLPWRLLDRLGLCFYLQGKYAEVEAMHRQTLQLQETVLGKDHPDTLMSMNNLAESLDQQEKYAEAEAIRRRGGWEVGTDYALKSA
jgi:hypothetical protein